MTKRKEAPSSAVRIRAMKRDRFKCTYCGVPGTDAELEIDHIVPVSAGGSHHISNLTTSCRACNQKKGSGTLDVSSQNNGNKKIVNGLTGMFLHTFCNGTLKYQGHIVAVDGDVVLVQLFSWLTGLPTNIEPMPKSVIYSKDCKLYATNDDMLNAYANMEAR